MRTPVACRRRNGIPKLTSGIKQSRDRPRYGALLVGLVGVMLLTSVHIKDVYYPFTPYEMKLKLVLLLFLLMVEVVFCSQQSYCLILLPAKRCLFIAIEIESSDSNESCYDNFSKNVALVDIF